MKPLIKKNVYQRRVSGVKKKNYQISMTNIYYKNMFAPITGLCMNQIMKYTLLQHSLFEFIEVCSRFCHRPRSIKFAFERKSDKSNANWVLTNHYRALGTCVWFFWLAFKRKFPWGNTLSSHISLFDPVHNFHILFLCGILFTLTVWNYLI